ncbi:MAG: glycosyltransferase family 4 protein [Methanomassiliicoccus sp.]|nr:glycosyltransferase family 4 protein [Methanomassiliicoccus sp.]
MRIATISALWGPAYPTGSGIYAFELSKLMARHGHRVDAYTSDTGIFNDESYSADFDLHRLKSHGFVMDMNPVSNVFFKLVRSDYDVVHVHSYVFFMSNSAAMARAFRDFKYVLTIHGGVDHENSPDSRCSFRFWLKDKIYDSTIGRQTVRLADKVITVCKKDMPIIEDKFGVEAEYVPNAVSTDMFNYDQEHKKEVVYVGKLERWKGADDLVKIFRKVHELHPDVKFKIVGRGSLAEAISNTNLPIETIGYIPHEEMPNIYGRSAVMILPSYMEGAPTTCMEASSCKVPVVATDVGDTKEIVKDGKSGFIHSPGDVDRIADSVVQLIEDESLCHEMGAYGRDHIVNNFSYGAVTHRMISIYESLLSDSQRSKPDVIKPHEYNDDDALMPIGK